MVRLVSVKPSARKDAVLAWDPDTRSLRLALAAPPVEGRANAALARFLGDRLGCAPSLVTLRTGAHARVKRVEVPDHVDLSALATASAS
jgi:uncharacterized protein YggU (UPF0235/DUF167 family)